MKLYAHPKTIRYFDYGTPLETVAGLCWSADGRAESSYGFEPGDFETLLAAKRAKLAAMVSEPGWAIEIGEPVERSCDMNPHGLI